MKDYEGIKYPDKERFLGDVKNHAMQVLRDDGLYRHLRFGRSGSSIYAFDLVTWPGHLAITGDMGSYTFSRIEDMFVFFGNEKGELRINPGYWAEKCISERTGGGIRKFDIDVFRDGFREMFIDNELGDREEEEREAERTNLIDQFREILLASDEYEAVDAVRSYRGELDLTEMPTGTIATWQYIWCLYAIVWGIGQYERRDP